MAALIDAQKAKTKEKMNREIDGYYSKYLSAIQSGKITINEIERMTVENQKKMRSLRACSESRG